MRLPAMLLALSLPLPLWAQTPVMIRQAVWSQVVTYPAVLSPQPAFQNQIAEGFFIVEYVPERETVEQWSQMQTLTGHRDAATEAAEAAARAEAVAVNFLDGYRSACATEVDALPLPIAPVQGAHGAFAAYLGCSDVLGQSRSEEMVVVVLVGERDTYTLQWA